MNLFSKATGSLLKFLLDIIFPRRCIHCGKTNPDGKYKHICSTCEKDIYIIRGGRCLRCGEIIGPNSAPNSVFCAKCLDVPPAFNWSLSCCIFQGPARDLIIGLKYRKALFLEKDIRTLTKENPNTEAFLSNAILVPVPLHFSRKISRGFNQSQIIANAAQKAFPNANISIKNLLKRTHKTPTQTKLNKEERAVNIKNAFKIVEKETDRLKKSAHIIIVDDVMTSGATMSECAKELKRNGFKNIDAFAFARRI